MIMNRLGINACGPLFATAPCARLFIALIAFVAPASMAHAQSLSDLVDRAKSEVQRAATQAVTQRPAPAASSPSSTSTPATTTAPAPSTAPPPNTAATPANPAAATDAMRKLPAWTQKLADGTRTLDFRNGVPESLKGRGFWPGIYVQLANPYAPADRITMLESKAMACHPEGGVVIWAQMIRQDISKPVIDVPNTDTGVGAYRVDAEGRVTPYAARDGVTRARFDPARSCATPRSTSGSCPTGATSRTCSSSPTATCCWPAAGIRRCCA
jgi:hypothetical protein